MSDDLCSVYVNESVLGQAWLVVLVPQWPEASGAYVSYTQAPLAGFSSKEYEQVWAVVGAQSDVSDGTPWVPAKDTVAPALPIISTPPLLTQMLNSYHVNIYLGLKKQGFFNTFMVAGITTSSLSFEARKLEFFPRALEFFQKPWIFENLELVFLKNDCFWWKIW